VSGYIRGLEGVRLITDYPQTVLYNRHNSSSISLQIPLEPAPKDGDSMSLRNSGKSYEYGNEY
jgi:hypothetical protein